MFFKKLSEFSKRSITYITGVIFLLIFHQLNVLPHLINLLFFVLYSEMLIATYISKVERWKKILVFIIGFVYLSVGVETLVEVITSGYALQFLACVFAIDTIAYFAGKSIQGPKLMPSVSPKKTVSGFVIAMLFGAMIFEVFFSAVLETNAFGGFLIGLLFAIIVQAGDLFVSFAKRTLLVKDASNLLPGHGGFWDRADSIFAGSIFFVIILAYFIPLLSLFKNMNMR